MMLQNKLRFFKTNKLFNSILTKYGAAILFVFIATILTLLIWFLIKPRDSYFFMGAVIVSAWWGGFRVGIFAVILSIFTIDFVFIPPRFQFTLFQENFFRLMLFAAQGILFCWLIEKNRQVTEEISASRENLRSLSLYQQGLLEVERKRISLEIHDELGQSLTSIKMDVHQLRKNLQNVTIPQETRIIVSERFSALLSSIDATIAKVRKIATDLRPPILDDFGTVAAIEWQAEEFEKLTGISCVINSNVEECHLDSEVSIAVFRIFQETLTNIARHAEASTVEVNFNVLSDSIILTISDDGKGINLTNIKSGNSLGILGMQERSRLIGGNLAIFPDNETGTVVKLIFPVKKKNNGER